ncbi:hypothetical protein LTR74_018320 [Friedmanniomyces endolithicus]|nr:hypothetical protein LTR74_018320 [Friedmanniomyces endolithicus]
MVESTRPPANVFVAATRKVYSPVGFAKGYNFILFFITMGYLLGFTLARLQYFAFYGIFCNPKVFGLNGAAPGECYFYLKNPFKIGMMLHLFTILPAAFLVVLQFVPVIRHKIMLIHRLNGYIIIILSLVSSAGVLILLPHAFGGDLATRTFGGTLVISTTVAYIMAYANIKLLQIDQHRAWMIRAWAYFASIITIRLIMFSSAAIISIIGGWYTTRSCAQINFIFGRTNTLAVYPACVAYYKGANVNQHVVVKATESTGANPIEVGASLGVTFGAAGWMAFWLHATGVELYLRLTPAESERLRQISYERQLARGFKRPGYAGFVAERFGDAKPYTPISRSRDLPAQGVNLVTLSNTNAQLEDVEAQ